MGGIRTSGRRHVGIAARAQSFDIDSRHVLCTRRVKPRARANEGCLLSDLDEKSVGQSKRRHNVNQPLPLPQPKNEFPFNKKASSHR
jgi:hypothetical protein